MDDAFILNCRPTVPVGCEEQVADAKCTRPFLPLVKGLAPRLQMYMLALSSQWLAIHLVQGALPDYTVKVHVSAREKFMRIGQNRPLEKFTRFLFMRLNVACIANIWRDNIYADTSLCDGRLTRIILINKTRAEKCRFTVFNIIVHDVNFCPHFPLTV